MAAESEALQYSRLLRPYSVKRLDKALWHVETTAAGIYQRKLRLLIDPPVGAPEWQCELEAIQAELEALATLHCPDAWDAVGVLIRSAPADYDRAVDAMHKVLLGINAEWRTVEGGEAVAS